MNPKDEGSGRNFKLTIKSYLMRRILIQKKRNWKKNRPWNTMPFRPEAKEMERATKKTRWGWILMKKATNLTMIFPYPYLRPHKSQADSISTSTSTKKATQITTSDEAWEALRKTNKNDDLWWKELLIALFIFIN